MYGDGRRWNQLFAEIRKKATVLITVGTHFRRKRLKLFFEVSNFVWLSCCKQSLYFKKCWYGCFCDGRYVYGYV